MSKDIPIIFSGPMVRALLERRKTMTRRVLKSQPQPFNLEDGSVCDVGVLQVDGEPRPRVTLGRVVTRQEIRYAIGDRLWVRENVACGACAPSAPSTWAPSFWRREQGTPANPSGLWYQADDLSPENPITDRGRWVPSIHMPRWASRLTLAVTGIKIERVQSISLLDVWAEGCEVRQFWLFGADGPERQRIGARVFEGLWRNLHGRASWDANPYVVAITFRVIKANIDAPEARAAA